MKINDHSHHYWDLVRKYMSSYQEKIDWLNANTTSILVLHKPIRFDTFKEYYPDIYKRIKLIGEGDV